MLAKYRHSYGPQGFNEYVAVDDCTVAAFGVAILAEESGSSPGPSSASSAPQTRREDPKVVPGSCRKYDGRLLVSCFPNGDNPERGYTITHCGELIDENVPLSSLHLRFHKEALEQEKALQTLMMIIGEEETYQLEKLTTEVREQKTCRKRDPFRLPPPLAPFTLEEPLALVTYLRSLTRRLIELKREYQGAKYRIEDRDFIYDVAVATLSDQPRKSSSWAPVQSVLRRCQDIDRRAHV